MPATRWIRTGGEHLLTASRHTLDGQVTHQAGDLIPADVMAGVAGSFPELVRPVDLAVRDPQHHQHLHEYRVTHHHARKRRGSSPVVRARSHLQRLADGLDSELVTMTVDIGDHHFCGRSSSAAKKAAAEFEDRISHAATRGSLARAVGAHRKSRFSLIESRGGGRVPGVRLSAAPLGWFVGCVDEVGEGLGEGLVFS